MKESEIDSIETGRLGVVADSVENAAGMLRFGAGRIDADLRNHERLLDAVIRRLLSSVYLVGGESLPENRVQAFL